MNFYFYCISVFMFISVFFCVPAYVWISGIITVSSFSIFLCMSQTRSRYKELGLKLVEPLQDQPRKSQRPPMAEEKKNEGVGYPFKILLKDTLKQQRNVMMDNFA